MRLTYWQAINHGDSECYNIRCKTKKEAVAVLANIWNPGDFGPIEKVVLEYADGFELMECLLGEGRENSLRVN